MRSRLSPLLTETNSGSHSPTKSGIFIFLLCDVVSSNNQESNSQMLSLLCDAWLQLLILLDHAMLVAWP